MNEAATRPNPLPSDVAIVTGAGNGIGRAIAVRLALRGAQLTLVDIDSNALAVTKEACGNTPIETVVADVSQESDVKRYVNHTLDIFGTIDYFANNAGIEGAHGRLTELSVKDFITVYQVNAVGVFLGLKHVLPVMIKNRRGAVVNTSSMAALRADADMGAYAASKAAVLSLTRTAAVEAGPHQVRVNAIAPGMIATNMLDRIGENSGVDRAIVQEFMTALTPLNRLGTPDEVAAVVAFLLSQDARYISASQITVDGAATQV